MSTTPVSSITQGNQSNPQAHTQLTSTPNETNPTDHVNISSIDNDVSSCNNESASNLRNHSAQEGAEANGNDEANIESAEQRNDSSTFSTAFTISFEDETSATKKLGIKDSIRKFAPPKPHTIEKPRQTKGDQCQDHSLVSIESAPAGYPKQSDLTRGSDLNSSRSSSRRSNSSRHSNISESAAFLIDRMLKGKENNPESTNPIKQLETVKSPPKSKKDLHSRKTGQSNANILDNEIDFIEDRSDNGTYIVGTDPESEAARKKIDELFGVVKAAEASVIADSANRMQRPDQMTASARKSRAIDKKPSNRGGQEHLSRLNYRNSSRSSSSSRQENSTVEQLSKTRNSRNSSYDRHSKVHVPRPRRSASQSSRQSSNKELSDIDTRSSRSSLHHDADEISVDNSASNHPNMKFNRAFALRRARLGLGEPVRVSSSQDPVNNMSSSHRRHQINSNTYKANHGASSSASFCRDDGGRFSLRTKNYVPPGRLSTAQQGSNRLSQHSTLIDNYIGKVSSAKLSSEPIPETQIRNASTKHLVHPCTSTAMPYQSGDELDTTMIPSKYMQLLKAGRLQRKGLTEMESDTDSYNQRLNYSLNDYETTNYNMIGSELRAASSFGGKRNNSNLQLGALDSLVISAISSLSLKIRQSICDVMIDQAKRLPVENETRLIVEEILPQITTGSKSPTSIEEIDQSLYFDLARTLKNLKKVEQMVDVINLISNQISSSPTTTLTSPLNSNSYNSNFKSNNNNSTGSSTRASDNKLETEVINDL